MSGTTDALVLDLVEWVAREPRLYSEVIETWRTSCPRLTIWEDAVDRGYVTRQPHRRGRADYDHHARREAPARQRPLIRRGPPVTQISVNVSGRIPPFSECDYGCRYDILLSLIACNQRLCRRRGEFCHAEYCGYEMVQGKFSR